jgi:UDP-N-acetylglucosamine acyltransferase
VPPFCTAAGDRARLRGLNLVGLRRRGFSVDAVVALKRAYRALFGPGRTVSARRDALARIRETLGHVPEVGRLVDFVAESERGVSR